MLKQLKNQCIMSIKFPIKAQSLSMKSIFQYMMEEGYNPDFQHSHIQFNLDGNIAVVDAEDGFVSLRIFFSIEKEDYELFLEASNQTMLKTYAIKPAVMDDMDDIVFSNEFFCDNLHDLKRFFPRAIETMKEALDTHKNEMRKLVMTKSALAKSIPATEEPVTGIVKKIFS